ncbi:hypothetical protein TSOC_006155 [Tetrabaena socialis]|uniref:Uncharacterized protein n=1 Tax=Tetrabaena socialis TaxID=47790 RepID=A0A2J8A4F3_9CHLO|nr:hypothetical protein TSOC_006155 [Tetrabaena socialis]|eukprot:PNH07387.1 hypothetical protein TSOC_006155 [Tetrabaena socialis]
MMVPLSSKVETDSRVRTEQCDVVLVHFYIPKMSGHTRPLALDGGELDCDSVWSGKGLISCNPPFVGEAEGLARVDPRTQVLAHQRRTPSGNTEEVCPGEGAAGQS